MERQDGLCFSCKVFVGLSGCGGFCSHLVELNRFALTIFHLKLPGKVVVPFVLVGSYKVLEGRYEMFSRAL